MCLGETSMKTAIYFKMAGWEFASFVFERDSSIQGAEETLFGIIAILISQSQ